MPFCRPGHGVFLVISPTYCLSAPAAGTVFARLTPKFRPLAVEFNGQIRKGTPFSSDSAEGAGIIYLYTIIKVNKARENAGIIYIHQSHRSRRGRHVYMISKSTRSSTRPAGGATMRSFELGGMPACTSTDSCRSTDNFRSTDTRSSASSSVPVGLCALFPAHRGQP